MKSNKYYWHVFVGICLLLSLSTCLKAPTAMSDLVLELPNSADPPPGDVLDQISVFGQGGEDEQPDCRKLEIPCSQLFENNLFIRGNSRGQEVRIVTYKYPDDGYQLFDYYTDWEVKLGADSTLFVNVKNMEDASIFVFLIYDLKTQRLITSSEFFTNAEDEIKQKMEFQCPSNIETHLCIHCTGRIINDRVRGNGLPNGLLFNVINGPMCGEDSIQWYVEIQEGQLPIVKKYGHEFWIITLNGQSFLRLAGHTGIFERFHGQWLAEKVE